MRNNYDEANKVTIKSIIWNLILTAIKVLAGIIGNSTAMIADGIHSASDIVSSIGVLIGNFIAKKPNDEEHSYGHEKAETLVSFLLSILLIMVSFSIGYNGIKLLFNTEEIKVPTLLPLIISVVSIIIKEYQYQITIKVAKKTNSPALKADAWHHRSDAFSSIAAFIGIGGALIGFKLLEPIATIIVALFILKVGLNILKISTNELMDYSIEVEEQEKIIDIASKIENVIEVRHLRTRKHGSFVYVDLTVQVDNALTVSEGHEVAHKIEEKILESMSSIKGILVHVEPSEKLREK
ncbi:cation diffusion facilitator family transporter [Gottschalkia purinilytica]|uniref:Cation diffusion facilitator family transporter n=1 Tax=Gottschalkia purinilytica TaxID=1503 RepID=A0A0L0W7S9_GOTPU|nr:cation diffusion facilitator family transporter [Gottschalkia purinilytica]KNF07599.1 cation diffusion facilitator family transporter [Gottschalkia purinilytica]